MVTAAIVINQTGKPPGLPSTSRDDLNLGVSVTLTNNDNTGAVSWFWKFVSKPVGSAAVISGAALPSASFVPDVRGSYLVKLTVDETPSNPATDMRIAAVKTVFLGIRKPATSEKKEFDSTDGWSAAQQTMIDAIDTDAALNLKRNGTNQPTADINWGTRKITNLGGLEDEGALRLGEIANPSSVSDKGFLYAKDDSGDTELFYMDDGGAVVQITKDGQLNVESLQGDALPTKTANGFLKRNSGNTAWEEVAFGSGSNTVCQGSDSRLSDSRTPTGSASGQLGGTYPGPDVRGIRETTGPTLLTIGAIYDGQVLVRAGSTLIGSSTAGGAGGKVKVRVDDAADGYLHEKLLTGPGLKFAIGSPGGNETLTIDAYGEAKVSSADTTFDYLEGKIIAGSNITIVKMFPGGNEQLRIAATGTGFDGYNVKVTATDTTPDFLNGKLVAGPNITLTVLTPGGNETLRITGSPSNTLGQSYNQGGPGAGRAITTAAGLPVQVTSSGGEAVSTDGYLGFSEMGSDPSALANKGLLYTKDVSGITELFYRGYGGAVVQLSKNGSLLVSLDQAYAFGGVGAGRTISIAAAKPVRLSGPGLEALATDGYLGLTEMSSDPSPLANTGLVYAQDDGYGRTGLYYMDHAGKESLLALDGYAGGLSGYDELDPSTTTGNETSLFLGHKPRSAPTLRMFRNGVMMRRVAVLGVNLNEYVWNGDRLVTFKPTLLAGEWYSAYYVYNK